MNSIEFSFRHLERLRAGFPVCPGLHRCFRPGRMLKSFRNGFLAAMGKRRFPVCLGLLILGVLPPTCAGLTVRFESVSHEVAGQGDVTLTLVIDGDDRARGLQPVANGLFHFGVRITYPLAQVEAGSAAVRVTPSLNYTGMVPGAAVESAEGSIRIRGNISLESLTSAPYLGSTLLTFTFRNRAPVGTRYQISLESARTAASQVMFIDGKGAPQDELVNYGAATVIVVPESDLPAPRMDIQRFSDDSIELLYTPRKGWDHYVEVSEDLRKWTDLFPVARNDGSILVPTDGRLRYFRLRLAPPKTGG